ncbi:MAG: glycoside hydrolase family 127 protein [Clostridiaceae bacterium]|nr:glycoside hydrolase family 127 protein [Clostridiaceae bacterium]
MNNQVWDNNEKNVIKDRVFSPLYGVKLKDGLFQKTFHNNIGYLKSLDYDAMLYWFRCRAGEKAPGKPYSGHFEDNIKGQTAGLFLMGAGHTLRWSEDMQLRRELTDMVREIGRCADADGYLMAVPKTEFGTKEYPHYVRIWLTYGLTAAALAGDTEAFGLLRRWQDWFNHCDDLPVIRYLMLAFQGVVASTYLYNTPVGRREDIDITVQYYEEDWRLAQFINNERDAIHKRNQPGIEPHPHGTEIEAMEGYLDLYRATGKHYYLRAVQNFYRLYQNDWEYPGGGIAMCEAESSYPQCYWLSNNRHYNELCCSSFWLLLNQRFHRLEPETESYVAEIESSIYNIGIANQNHEKNIFYFAHLDQEKKNYDSLVHCCCGVGTKLFGALPEYIYSLGEQELYVDLFAASELTWERDQGPVVVSMETAMPYQSQVTLRLTCDPQAFAMKIRMPRWLAGPIVLDLNGRPAAEGRPGTYVVIERSWQTGDTISFTLPFAWRPTKYIGAEQVEGYERWAYEAGPLLMAFKGQLDGQGCLPLPFRPDEIPGRLQPAGESMHFTVNGLEGVEVVPYLEIEPLTPFTCFPIFAAQ